MEKPEYFHLNPLRYPMVRKTVPTLNVFTNQIVWIRKWVPNRYYEH